MFTIGMPDLDVLWCSVDRVDGTSSIHYAIHTIPFEVGVSERCVDKKRARRECAREFIKVGRDRFEMSKMPCHFWRVTGLRPPLNIAFFVV